MEFNTSNQVFSEPVVMVFNPVGLFLVVFFLHNLHSFCFTIRGTKSINSEETSSLSEDV